MERELQATQIGKEVNTVINRVKKMWIDEEGLTTVEYALLLALLVVAALGTWTTFGGVVRDKVTSSGNSLNSIS